MSVPNPFVPQIILETDMCTDVDDAGALAVLHALADAGECGILAISYNASHPHGAGALAAINTWYGRGDLPIGVYKGSHPDTTDPSAYCETLHAGFPNAVGLTESMPDALEIYRRVLPAAEDGSVVIVSIGFTQILSQLVVAEPDLVAHKVRELVIMGLTTNDGWNLAAHEMEAYTRNVIERWPGRITFSPAGRSVVTGQRMVETPIENPVRAAYKWYYEGVEGRGRSSWDQIAVLYAVRGVEGLFELRTEGACRLKSGWTWELGDDCREVRPLESVNWVALIEDLMVRPPAVRAAESRMQGRSPS